ncbi:MAG TPA: carboxy terminal-processing peptidase [Cyclobacteriaceae bacterium]|nr:carboxy terminal-processing peptidase [Cyclobacteriaceae bacterium]
MKKRLGVLLFCVVMVHAGWASAPDTVIKAKPVYGKEAKLVADVLRQAHFRKMPFNDSLSSVVFDRYFKELDNNKIYFLSSDIEQFEKFRFQLDDLTREGNVNIAFDIYKVFQGRNRARLHQVIDQLVKKEFDYTADEYYETDRDKAVWASTNLVLDDEWRKMVKSQALSLKLTGKKQDEITDLLRKRYERLLRSYQQLNSEDVFSMYLNCITEAYDPHTNYLSPKATDLFKQQMSLSLEGIGARLQVDNDYTKVVEIVAGGPADKSGLLHPNDLITGVAQGVEGEMVDVTGWRIDDVVKLIKGPKGTLVRLQVLPASTGVSGPATTISLVRDKVKLEDQAAKKQVITYSQNGKTLKMGVIVLPGFYQDFDEARKGNPNYRSTTRDVRRLIGELQAEGVTGIVMDLRNNGGGSLAEAISLTGLFIKDGPVVQVRDSRSRVDVFADDDPKVVYTGPLVVLTNRFSASASEIFAGAIQDYHRGLIVGESTFGKGTVQSVIDLTPYVNDPDKVGELKYTFQKFYRVTGSSTQHKGVTPDIQLPSALKPEQFGESASPNALPWDVIQRAEFQRVSDIDDKLIASLKKNYAERLKSDAVLRRYEGEVEEMRKNLEETRISLNEAKRRQEIDEAEKKKKANDPLDTKITSKEGVQNEDLSKLKDEYLREGLLLLSDIITKRIG